VWCKDAVVLLFIMEPGSVPCFSKKLRWVRGGGALGEGRGRWTDDGLRRPGPAGGLAIAGVRLGRPDLGSAGHAALEGRAAACSSSAQGCDGWMCSYDGNHIAHMSLSCRPFPIVVWRLSEPRSSSWGGGWRRGGLLVHIKE
jgi:hypothetical protein